jgi:hypothetical protein
VQPNPIPSGEPVVTGYVKDRWWYYPDGRKIPLAFVTSGVYGSEAMKLPDDYNEWAAEHGYPLHNDLDEENTDGS